MNTIPRVNITQIHHYTKAQAQQPITEERALSNQNLFGTIFPNANEYDSAETLAQKGHLEIFI